MWSAAAISDQHQLLLQLIKMSSSNCRSGCNGPDSAFSCFSCFFRSAAVISDQQQVIIGSSSCCSRLGWEGWESAPTLVISSDPAPAPLLSSAAVIISSCKWSAAVSADQDENVETLLSPNSPAACLPPRSPTSSKYLLVYTLSKLHPPPPCLFFRNWVTGAGRVAPTQLRSETNDSRHLGKHQHPRISAQTCLSPQRWQRGCEQRSPGGRRGWDSFCKPWLFPNSGWISMECARMSQGATKKEDPVSVLAPWGALKINPSLIIKDVWECGNAPFLCLHLVVSAMGIGGEVSPKTGLSRP